MSKFCSLLTNYYCTCSKQLFLSLSAGTLLLTVPDFELRTTVQYFFIKLNYLSLRAKLFEIYYALQLSQS
jgi:hypothetical protein